MEQRISQLQAIVDTAVDGVIQIDAQGLITLFNPACEKLFGYTADEVIGRNVKMLMPSPYREEHDGYLDNYRRTGVRKIIGIGREVVGQRKDGTTFPMELSVGEAHHEGEPIFVGVVRDISERKGAEEALLESAARLSAVVDTAVDGVILIDDQGAVQMFNPACEKLFGYSAGEVIGKNVKMLMPSPYREEHDGYLDNFRRTGERKIIGIGREVVGQRKDGTTFPMELSVGEASQGGEPLFVGVIHDITERKLADAQRERFIEELVESNEERGHFAYVASHDLQQHLRMVAAFSSLLAEQYTHRLDEKAREYVGHIVDGAEQMRELIDDLLEYGRLGAETGRVVHFDADERMADVIERLEPLIHESDAEVIVDDLPGLHGNPVRFSRLMQNLISNALKYVAKGVKPRVHVGVKDDGDVWRFSVSDNGIGIDPAYQKKIFEPFRRLHARSAYAGSGLGLAICDRIVKGFGGAIWVESRPGAGSTFYFTVLKSEDDQ